MKKLLYITFGLFICALSVNNANAAALTQTGGAGSEVTVVVNTANVPGAKSIIFNPSSNVNMSGASDSTSWALAGYHTQANQKANGQQYGMAANSNAMWFADISTTAAGTITGTTSAAFTSGTWFSM